MSFCRPQFSLLMLLSAVVVPSMADTTEARCDIYPKGSDQASAVLACQFSQRQGFVSIQRADGQRYELTPGGDSPGNYTDQHGRPAYRDSGLGKDGLIFRLADVSVYVYWDASTLPGDTAGPASPTAPYTTANYSATTVLSCSLGDTSGSGDCPAGVRRGDGGSASVHIMRSDGVERILNFDASGGITSPGGGEIHADRDAGGDFTVTIDGKELYRLPEALLYGG